MSVYDIEDYSVTPDSNTVDIGFTRSQCSLAATWGTAGTAGKEPERYEWSVGVTGEPIGQPLLDVLNEPIWREAGNTNMAVFTTGSSLKSGTIAESIIDDIIVLVFILNRRQGVFLNGKI